MATKIVEQKFEKGINLKMQQVLDMKDSCGIVFFGTVKQSGKAMPVMILHEDLGDLNKFQTDFFKFMEEHGVTIS